MASTRLVFQQPRHTGGNPVPLVFGAGGQAEVPVGVVLATLGGVAFVVIVRRTKLAAL